MKKTILLIISSIFLSACSIIPSSSDGGVFRSDDGGKTFQQKVIVDANTRISSADVLSLAVNPQNGNEAYIGTKSSGVFKTVDAGENWQVVKMAPTTPTKVYAIVYDTSDPRNIYATVLIDNRAKIVKSQDSGATWKDVYVEPATGSIVLAIALNPQDSRKIFAGTTGGRIIFSDNAGDSWKNLYEARSEIFKIAIDYFDPSVAYFAVNQGAPLRTVDGGNTFENMEEKHIVNRETGLENTSSMMTDPNRPGWVYFGSPVGLFRSKDRGENWDLIKVLNRPQENEIRGMALNPSNSDELIYGAAQAFYKSVDGGQSWATTQFAGKRTIETVAYNKQNPGMIYAGMNSR